MYIDTPINRTTAVIFDNVALPVLPHYREPLSNEFCVIDWLSFTFKVPKMSEVNELIDYDELIAFKISDEIERITGFGIEKELGRGQNFYRRTFLFDKDRGSINIGGQNDTVLVTINGNGCTHAELAWEYHIVDFMRTLEKVKITRLDIAFDDVNGVLVSPLWADKVDDLGGFSNHGRYPMTYKAGDWKRPNGQGLTFYVGSKKSSKHARIYEKGKQLGFKDSKWSRIELQIKCKCYYIPLNAITEPTQYFMSAYPCFAELFDTDITPKQFEIIRKKGQIDLAESIEITKKQFGRHIHALREIFNDDELVFDLLTDIENKDYPQRLDMLSIDYYRDLILTNKFN